MARKRNSFVKQAMFLTGCGIIVRIIGVLYGIPLTNIIGDLGNFYYSSAYNIYSILLLVCSYSIPMAVSKIMAEKTALGQFRTAHRVFKCSLLYVVVVGGIAAIYLLEFGGIFIFFSGIATVLNGVLQGIGKVNIPMKNAAIALGLHIAILVPVLICTDLHIYAILIATSLYAIIICVLNYRFICKFLNYRQEWKKTFVIPIFASAIMGVCARIVYHVIYALGDNAIDNSRIKGALTVGLAVCVAVVVYFPIVLKFGYSDSERKRIPIVSKFFRH
ncbi:MATE family efflux transporter [Anaerosacchariphilus polymeriproducens]|nr:polysaccharide biosynthesis C-terminal domain-containing protein [Anaerosacchariphilus polymeriproducens]